MVSSISVQYPSEFVQPIGHKVDVSVPTFVPTFLMATLPIDILLVEDNPGDVFLIQRMLEACALPYKLHRVDNGQAAIEFLHHYHTFEAAPSPQLILLDLNLPILNGKEVLTNIKTDPHLCQIPVVVLSTSNAPEDIEESYRLKADYYVTKPGSYTELGEKAQDIHNFWVQWQDNN